MEWEVSLMEWLQNNLGDFCSVFGKIFSFIGGEMGLLIMFLILLFCWKKEAGKRVGLVVIMVSAWLPMLKCVVKRLRPFMEYPDRVKPLALEDKSASPMDISAQGYSFPSQHSASVAALYFQLAHEAKKRWLWILAIVFTVLVGFSRVATGMHYPTDVLAGWALGFVIIGIHALLLKFIPNETARHLVVLAVSLLGLIYIRTEDYFTALGMLIGFVVAVEIEKRFVQFKDTRNIWAMILRIVGAFVIYFVLNKLLKLPFSSEFLGSGSFAALLVRSARYAIIVFVILGLFPKMFPLFEKIGGKKRKK